MVDWRNPETELMQSEALVKVVHVMDGIYIWDFLSTCKYERSLLTGKTSFRWTVWLYLGCRFFTLAEVVADLTGLNIMTPIKCRLWVILLDIFAYTASSLALALYGIRTVAIWKRQPYVTAFITTISVANICLWVRTTVQARSTWDTMTKSCTFQKTDVALVSAMGTLATHVLILATMVIGILRHKPSWKSLFWRFQREGVWWLAMSTAVQIVYSTFVALNLNDIMNLMFETPTLICSTIGATRIFRSIYTGYRGDLLQYMETSIDERGKVHFRKRYGERLGDSTPNVNHIPMSDLRSDVDDIERNRFVERFSAREIDVKESEIPYGSHRLNLSDN